MILTAFAPRRARPAAAARVWWCPRTAGSEPSLEASSLAAGTHSATAAVGAGVKW